MTFVNQWTDNNFLCLPASIFVFITLIVSTQARHLNTWWGQILVKTLLVWLSAPGIFYSWESCVFYVVYNQPRKLFCPFFEHFLVYTTTGMGHWFLYALKWTISFTRSKAISVPSVTELFNTLFKIDLALYFASDVVFCGWK